MAYDAVLFDNDGILVEPTGWDEIRPAIHVAFERLGVPAPDEQHVDRLIGVTVEDVHAVADAYDLDPAALWRERDAAASEAQVSLLREGGKPRYDDVDAIPSMPGPRAIVSNNQHATVQAIVDQYEMGAWFDAVFGRRPTIEDIRRKKPSPYYLERALEALGADSALFVGDSPKDLVAARRAGVDAAFVRRAHRADVELPFQPQFEVADLEELASRLD